MKYAKTSFGNDVMVQRWPCPYCGAPNDAASEVTGETVKPKAGDLLVCYNCGGFCEYDELGLTTKLKDFDGLPQVYKDILNLQKAAVELRKAAHELRNRS